MKRTTQTRQRLNELTDIKSKYLIEMGQEVYLAYRRGDDIEGVVAEKASSIQEVDSEIYALLREQKPAEGDVMTCSCGASLTEEDVFCPECGKKVTRPDEQPVITTTCSYCQNEVPTEADYCYVCGMKMRKVYPGETG